MSTFSEPDDSFGDNSGLDGSGGDADIDLDLGDDDEIDTYVRGANDPSDTLTGGGGNDSLAGGNGLDGSAGDIPTKPPGMLGTATWEGTTQTWIARDEDGNSVNYDRDGNPLRGTGPGFNADGTPKPGSPYITKFTTAQTASLAKTLKELGLLGADGKLSTQGALIGTGLAALMSYLGGGNQSSGSKAPPYVQAPLYNRGFTAPMKDPVSGATYYFNRNPFDMDPTRAPNIQGPSQEEAQQQRNAYEAGLADLYTHRAEDRKQPLQGEVPQAFAGSQYVEGAPPKEMSNGGIIAPTNSPDSSPYFLSPSAPQPREVLSYKSGQDNSSGSDYAKGGYLNGPGDGMSDHIPATINGKQPAKLSDGEFVLPADIVASIGNGSNKAGSTKLYAIMDKIRQSKYGRKTQPPKMSDQGIANLFTK
jgi:hypothetical protein